MTGPTADTKPAPRAALVLFALTLAYIFNLLDRSIVYILQEQIKGEFALKDWHIGLLSGASFGLFYSVMGIPIARLSETRSRVRLLKICIVAWSGLTALCGAAQSFWMLLAVRTGVAIGEAGGSPLSHSIISDYYPPHRRSAALATYTVAVPLGLLAGAAFGGFLAQTFGWRWTFVIVGFPGILVALLVHLVVKEPRRGAFDAVQDHADETPPPTLRDVVGRTLRNRRIVLVLAASSVSAFAAWGVTTFMTGWLIRRFQISTQDVGLIFALIYGVFAGIGTWMGGRLNDRLGALDERWYMLLPALCMAVAAPLYILGFSQTNVWVATGILCVPALLTNAHYGATFSTVSNAFDARSRTTAVSLMFLIHALIGMSLGPLFTGALSDVFAAQASDAGSTTAVASGLTQAMIVTSAIFLAAAALYAWAAAYPSTKSQAGAPQP